LSLLVRAEELAEVMELAEVHAYLLAEVEMVEVHEYLLAEVELDEFQLELKYQ
jgi:hypothetical protein